MLILSIELIYITVNTIYIQCYLGGDLEGDFIEFLETILYIEYERPKSPSFSSPTSPPPVTTAPQ